MKSKKNKIIVFANQKGGVGKSTLCILLADYLAYWKKDVCIIDTDLQQSATLQREQDRLTFGEEEPYSIQSFEVSDPKTMQMLMENALSQDGFVLFDAPGTIKDDGLAPMFIYADYIICPFEYESKSLSSTKTFIQVINRLRQLNPQMNVQIYFVPNKVDARMGTREELELWKQTDEEFAQSGIVAPPVGYRAQMKRVYGQALKAHENGFHGAQPEGCLDRRVFHGYADKAAAMQDMGGPENRCPQCDRLMKAGRWYPQPGRRYMNMSTCPEHGKFLVRIRLSLDPDGALRVSRLIYEGTSEAAQAYEKVAQKPRRQYRRSRKRASAEPEKKA